MLCHILTFIDLFIACPIALVWAHTAVEELSLNLTNV